MPLRRLLKGRHAARAEFFLDGVAVREGGSETAETIAHGLVEYRILNIEQGILKWWWTLRSSIFRVGYWIFIMCLLGESRDGDTPTALVVTTSKLAAPPNRLSPKRPRANETSVYRQIAEPRLQPWVKLLSVAAIPSFRPSVLPSYRTGFSRFFNRNSPSAQLDTTITPLSKNG